MSLFVAFTTVATAINGLLAGLNVDTALVKLPARRRIGASAYATFARGNDLGNGLIVYPLLGISAALFTVLVTVLAFVTQSRGEVLLLLSLASLLSLLHTFATTRAAPTMLSLKDATQDDALVRAKLGRFVRWHTLRALFQVPVFVLLLWTLAVV
jgi:hypothetical protein